MEKQNIGEYLQKFRKDMSLGEVEKMTGISKSYLSKVERGIRGIPGPKTLKKLADAYSADYMELLSIAGYIREEPEITIIRRALKRMTPANKEAMIKLLRTSFPGFFEPV